MSLVATYMKDSATRVRESGRDQWGEPTGTASTTLDCVQRMVRRMVRDRTGNLVESSGHLLLKATDEPQYEDRYQVDGVDYVVVKIVTRRTWGVTDHYEVYLA